MAQWKRAGPITQRFDDQNLALLIVLDIYFATFIYFLFYGVEKKQLHAHKILLNFIETEFYFYLDFYSLNCF